MHHDAAIHVTPTRGSAGALAGRVSQDATQSDFPNISLIRPAVPGPRVHHDAAIHVTPTGSAGALAGRVSQDATH